MNDDSANGPDASTADDPRARRVPRLATAAAATALACGLCCVLPVAVPALALGTLGGVVAVIGKGYWWATWLAAGAVGAGWTWVAWQSLRSGRRPAAATLRSMAGATLVVTAAFGWPVVEHYLVAALRG